MYSEFPPWHLAAVIACTVICISGFSFASLVHAQLQDNCPQTRDTESESAVEGAATDSCLVCVYDEISGELIAEHGKWCVPLTDKDGNVVKNCNPDKSMPAGTCRTTFCTPDGKDCINELSKKPSDRRQPRTREDLNKILEDAEKPGSQTTIPREHNDPSDPAYTWLRNAFAPKESATGEPILSRAIELMKFSPSEERKGGDAELKVPAGIVIANDPAGLSPDGRQSDGSGGPAEGNPFALGAGETGFGGGGAGEPFNPDSAECGIVCLSVQSAKLAAQDTSETIKKMWEGGAEAWEAAVERGQAVAQQAARAALERLGRSGFGDGPSFQDAQDLFAKTTIRDDYNNNRDFYQRFGITEAMHSHITRLNCATDVMCNSTSFFKVDTRDLGALPAGVSIHDPGPILEQQLLSLRQSIQQAARELGGEATPAKLAAKINPLLQFAQLQPGAGMSGDSVAETTADVYSTLWQMGEKTFDTARQTAEALGTRLTPMGGNRFCTGCPSRTVLRDVGREADAAFAIRNGEAPSDQLLRRDHAKIVEYVGDQYDSLRAQGLINTAAFPDKRTFVAHVIGTSIRESGSDLNERVSSGNWGTNQVRVLTGRALAADVTKQGSAPGTVDLVENYAAASRAHALTVQRAAVLAPSAGGEELRKIGLGLYNSGQNRTVRSSSDFNANVRQYIDKSFEAADRILARAYPGAPPATVADAYAIDPHGTGRQARLTTVGANVIAAALNSPTLRGETISSVPLPERAPPPSPVPTLIASPFRADPDRSSVASTPTPVEQIPATMKIPRGATLTSIARQHNTTVEELLSANPQIRNPNRIIAGEQLNLPTIVPPPLPIPSPTRLGAADPSSAFTVPPPERAPTRATEETPPLPTRRPQPLEFLANYEQDDRDALKAPQPNTWAEYYSDVESGLPAERLQPSTVEDTFPESATEQQLPVQHVITPTSIGEDDLRRRLMNLSPRMRGVALPSRPSEADRLSALLGPAQTSEQIQAATGRDAFPESATEQASEAEPSPIRTSLIQTPPFVAEDTVRVYPVTGNTEGGASPFFRDRSYGHAGVDIYPKRGLGSPDAVVVSPVNGTIIKSQLHSGYGWTIDIQGEDGKIYRLAHVAQPRDANGNVLRVGDSVSMGQAITRINGSGTAFGRFAETAFKGDVVAAENYLNATGWRNITKPHLHFEVRTAPNTFKLVSAMDPGELFPAYSRNVRADTVAGSDVSVDSANSPPLPFSSPFRQGAANTAIADSSPEGGYRTDIINTETRAAPVFSAQLTSEASSPKLSANYEQDDRDALKAPQTNIRSYDSDLDFVTYAPLVAQAGDRFIHLRPEVTNENLGTIASNVTALREAGLTREADDLYEHFSRAFTEVVDSHGGVAAYTQAFPENVPIVDEHYDTVRRLSALLGPAQTSEQIQAATGRDAFPESATEQQPPVQQNIPVASAAPTREVYARGKKLSERGKENIGESLSSNDSLPERAGKFTVGVMQFAAGTIAESTKAFENFVRGTTGESQEPYTREQMAKDLLAFSPLGGISGAIGKGTAATLLRNTVGQANNPLRTGAPVVARTGREVDNIEPLARPSVPAVQTGVSSGQTTVPQSSSLLERLRALQTSPASPPRSTPVPAPTQSFPSSVPQQQAPASLMERLNALHTPQTIGPQSLPPTLRAPASQSTPPARLSDLPGIQPLPTISSRPQSAIGAPGEALQRLNSTAQELNEQFILLIRRLYQR